MPNNLGRGELDEVTGHIAQVKWNQILPYGLKRTIPISNATNEGDHVPVSTAGGGVNNSDTATTHNAAIDKWNRDLLNLQASPQLIEHDPLMWT